MPDSTADAIRLTTAHATAVVLPSLGARVGSLVVDGTELLVTEGWSLMEWGMYPMVPWAGRTRDARFTFRGHAYPLVANLPPNAIHGTAFDTAWRVEEVLPDRCRLKVGLGTVWPFAGSVEHEIALEDAPGGATLRLRLGVRADDGPMPAVAGWHPWFRRHLDRGAGTVFCLPAARMFEVDAAGLPTGRLVAPSPGPWDDCFTALAGPVSVTWAGAAEATLETGCDHVVVYDRADPGVCVEPQTGPPDALNLGSASVVEPGRPLVASCAWRIAVEPRT